MREETTEQFFIKALCAKENRKRIKKLLFGAVVLNVGAFSFMYFIIYLMLWIDKYF